jgi:hypothetical protein
VVAVVMEEVDTTPVTEEIMQVISALQLGSRMYAYWKYSSQFT